MFAFYSSQQSCGYHNYRLQWILKQFNLCLLNSHAINELMKTDIKNKILPHTSVSMNAVSHDG